MKKIEDQMNHLRGEMDVEEPRVDLMWGRIESKIEQPAKLRSMWKYWAAAAGVAAIFALGYWSAGSPDPIAQPQLSIADLDPQMGQEEQRLQNEFMSRQAVLKEYEFNPEEVLIFESELAQIERKVALVQNPENDLLSEDHREGGHPEIDDAVLQLQLDPAIGGGIQHSLVVPS